MRPEPGQACVFPSHAVPRTSPNGTGNQGLGGSRAVAVTRMLGLRHLIPWGVDAKVRSLPHRGSLARGRASPACAVSPLGVPAGRALGQPLRGGLYSAPSSDNQEVPRTRLCLCAHLISVVAGCCPPTVRSSLCAQTVGRWVKPGGSRLLFPGCSSWQAAAQARASPHGLLPPLPGPLVLPWTGREGAVFIPRELCVSSRPPAVLQDLDGPLAGRIGAWGKGQGTQGPSRPLPHRLRPC